MLRRLWLWSPLLQIFMVFTVAASPTWRNTLLTIRRFCALPHLAMDHEVPPRSCAPLKTVSSQHWQRISVLGFQLVGYKSQNFHIWVLIIWPQVHNQFAVSHQVTLHHTMTTMSQLSMCVFVACSKWMVFEYLMNFFYVGEQVKAS